MKGKREAIEVGGRERRAGKGREGNVEFNQLLLSNFNHWETAND